MSSPTTRTISSLFFFFFLHVPMGYASKMMPAASISRLKGFENCSQFKAKLRDLSKLEYRRSHAYRGHAFESDLAKSMPRASGAPAKRKKGSGSAAGLGEVSADDRTGTNNQHAQVDEADFVKFDGRHIYQLQDGKLRIMQAWPAKTMRQVASVKFEGQGRELLVGNGIAVVMSALSGQQTVGVFIIDIKQPTKPKVLTRFDIPGRYLTARLIGETVRIVAHDYTSFIGYAAVQSSQSFSWMKNFKWANEEEKRQAMINNLDMHQLLKARKTYRVLNGQKNELDVLGDCQNVYMGENSSVNALTRLVTLNLKSETYSEAWAFVSPKTVYVSESALYLAHSGYGRSLSGGGQQTAIHKFDLTAPQAIKFAATGIVKGHLLNQFSLDEHEGHLRVAVNSHERLVNGWRDNAPRWGSVNRILVLKQSGPRMDVIGQTKNLAEGERIYAVRFAGDKGFLVTFRQVDPLFTLDLSQPTQPRVVGELKVPGFSSYIHVLENDRLLTIGKDADPKTGRARGIKLSLFDTSDFKNPREIKSLLFNTAASSEASYDHKAFTYYRQKGILAIPMTARNAQNRWVKKVGSTEFRSSLLLFRVGSKSIKPAGELQMGDLYTAQSKHTRQWWQQNSGVRRSFFSKDIVYAIGNGGIRAAKIKAPHKPVATIRFQENLASK